MTKGELLKEVKNIANQKDEKLNIQQVETVYDAVLSFIKQRSIADGKLSITDFGVFEIKTCASRNGVNPKTQEKIVIPERKKIKFSPARAFQESVK